MKTAVTFLAAGALALILAAPVLSQNAAGTPPLSNGSPQNTPMPQKLILPVGSGDEAGMVWTNKDSYSAGQAVHITFTVANKSKSVMNYDFPTSKQYDIFVTDAKGTEVWRWSQGRVFAQVLTHLALKPGQSKTFDAVWNGRDAKGQPVPPGQYTVNARLTSNDRPAIVGGVVINNDTDPNNMGMPTRSPVENGVVRQVDTNPSITAVKTITIIAAK